jgi:hypothetical protein
MDHRFMTKLDNVFVPVPLGQEQFSSAGPQNEQHSIQAT